MIVVDTLIQRVKLKRKSAYQIDPKDRTNQEPLGFGIVAIEIYSARTRGVICR